MDLTSTSEQSCKEGTSEDRRKTSGKSPSAPLAPTMATIVDDDERLLARIGYKQVNTKAPYFYQMLICPS